MPETGDGGGIAPEEFPNLMHASAESEYLGFDRMFDRGLRALVRGLIIDRITPTPAQEIVAQVNSASR